MCAHGVIDTLRQFVKLLKKEMRCVHMAGFKQSDVMWREVSTENTDKVARKGDEAGRKWNVQGTGKSKGGVKDMKAQNG